ncbi:MAG: SGNH/GDSL hydrolase family protein [Anaerolineales bacterium]|nr:SGNH/GDSL hydrolase family protein [Anaerolineales bacterium]
MTFVRNRMRFHSTLQRRFSSHWKTWRWMCCPLTFAAVFLTAMLLVSCQPAPTEDLDRPAASLVPISEGVPEAAASGGTPEEQTTAPAASQSMSTATVLAEAASDPDAWMELPVIPEFSSRAVEIYLQGMAMGNDPHAFAKVGDCQNVPSMYLSMFDIPNAFSLGVEYADLQVTIDWYAGSFARESEAVRRGFNAASLVSAFWSDPEVCEPGETPLQCEIRLHNPSIAIISLETWWEGAPENYEGYLRNIVEETIDAGVLPVLATKADNVEGDHHINRIIAMLAAEYDIPLWNFWRAVQPLPNHGLSEDGFHLTFAASYFDDPERMESAWPWRNLTALQVLDAARITLNSLDQDG